jgi:acetyl esterase/lipase
MRAPVQLLNSGPPFKGLDTSTDVPALRAHLLEMKRNLINANTAAEESTTTEEDLQIPTRDHSQITLRIYKSKSAQVGGAPILVMYHGGGFCLGSLDNETLNCRRWVERFGGVAVNVDYRLAPEHAFPTAVQDAYDALKWVRNAVSPLCRERCL